MLQWMVSVSFGEISVVNNVRIRTNSVLCPYVTETRVNNFCVSRIKPLTRLTDCLCSSLVTITAGVWLRGHKIIAEHPAKLRDRTNGFRAEETALAYSSASLTCSAARGAVNEAISTFSLLHTKGTTYRNRQEK